MYETIDLVLGGVFILFYSGQRFNTPPTNRSSTTAGRYFMALFFYCLVEVGFYVTLVKSPRLLSFLVQGNDVVPVWAREISSPLLVALSLTVLLPKLPFLSTMDHWICRQLQNLAAIPYEVRRLSAELRRGRLHISIEEQTAIRQRLEDDGFDPKDVVFDEPAREPANLWTRLTALLQKVEDWESDRRMASYLAAFHGELENLRRRHQCLASKAKTCFRLLDENAAGGATGKTHEAVVRYEEDFTEHVGQLHQQVLDFIARGVLHAELTDSARLNRLKALGFSVEWARAVFTLNQMMLLFGVVCIVMLWGFVMIPSIGEVRLGVLLAKAIMISMIYSVAVACAVLPKAKWKFAKAQPDDVRPMAFYLVAGLMAVGISQFISLTFNSVLMRGIEGGWHRFQLTYPWLLVTFGTALMTGILVDNPRFPRVSRWQQRCIEGFVQGAVMLGVAYLTHCWLRQRIEMRSIIPSGYSVPPLISVMGMSGVVGIVIGFCIPTWYREAPRRHPEIHEADRAVLPLPASFAAQSSESLISV